MQQLAGETIAPASRSELAERLLEIIPLVTRRIRAEMQSRTMGGLSMPQFRALSYLRRHPEAPLNALADHLGLTAPTASKLIQKLVNNGVVTRRVAADRRRVCLSLTQSGIAALSLARSETRQQLANSLKSLSGEELAALSIALRALGRAFSKGGTDVNLS